MTAGAKFAELSNKRTPQIVTLDIETLAHVVRTFGLFDQNIGLNQIIAVGRIHSFAAKWYGKAKIHYFSEAQPGGHEAMVLAAWDILDRADIVVGHNSRAFDLKHLNREFILAGLTPPSPYKQVDTLTVARSQLKFASNKLDHIAQQLGIGGKVSHSGFQLWLNVEAGDPKALRLFERYCKQDVALTEKLYDRLRPWVKNHPNMGLIMGVPGSCTNCGGAGPHEYHGLHFATAQAYDRYKCCTCGAWLRGTAKRSAPIGIRQAA